jgi:cytidylate kinase
MSSILISSQSFTSARDIARRTAETLDYRHVDEEVFRATSARFDVQEAKLREAFEREPTMFGMSGTTRKRLLAYLQATLSAMLLEDGVVYSGPYAHALVTGVSHILRVKLVASAAHRSAAMIRDENLSPKKASRRVAADDERSRAISEALFGKDVSEEGYDLVVDVGESEVDGTAEAIAGAVREKRYVPMSFSKKVMREVELAHRLRSLLVDLDADAAVEVVDGGVNVRAHASGSKRAKTAGTIEQRLHGIEGIEQVHVQVFDNDLTSAGRR